MKLLIFKFKLSNCLWNVEKIMHFHINPSLNEEKLILIVYT